MGSDGGNLFAALSDYEVSQTTLFGSAPVRPESTSRGLFGDRPTQPAASNREKIQTTNIFNPVSQSSTSASHGLFGLPLSPQANNSALGASDEGTTSVAPIVSRPAECAYSLSSHFTSTSDGLSKPLFSSSSNQPSSEQNSTSFHNFRSSYSPGSEGGSFDNTIDSKESSSRPFPSPFVWKRNSSPSSEATYNLHQPSLFAAIDSKNIHPVAGLFKAATENPAHKTSLFNQPEKSMHTQHPSISPVSSVSSPKETLVSPSASESSPLSSSPASTSSVSATNVLSAIKLSHLDVGLNQKAVLTKLFSRFGSIQRIICQPSLDTAIIAFASSAEAHKAKMEAYRVTPGVTVSLARCVKRNSVASLIISPQKSLGFFHQTKCGSFGNGMNRRSAASPSSSNPALTDVSAPIACTVDERLAALEARDEAEHRRIALAKQLVRKPSARGGGGVAGRATIHGACPDMCPETERYLRECRQRVSVFECLTSSLSAGSSAWRLDHTRAVKDYSRSSADQAEPLPWELRPPEVLERTMAYLLASIADRPEIDSSRSLWKTWYEFLWTRTRAIRKDITQQNIYSPTIISIVEKVTRFHIFCAARLVDQPMDAFDPRINSENLTQCLQTLKQLYDDLKPASLALPADAVDPCPCEAEFRAYMILMKLNDASVLAEVQKFPAALRKSAPVRFAMEVNFAVTERNFIRFFRLVRQADCLTACLLHRYFGQVRSQALYSMAAAFNGHPRHEVLFPLSTLVHQLAFESISDAQAFCEHWGLSVTDTDLVFHRQCPPRLPELPWKERRAPSLIESKRAGIRLSELFNGGPVNPSDAIPPPVHSSFDAHNRLLPTPVSVSDAPDLPIEVPPPASPLKKQDSPPLASTPPQAPATLTTPSASVTSLPTSLFGTSATHLPPTPSSRPVLSVSTPPALVKKKGFDDKPAVNRSGLAVRSLAAISELCDDLIADLVNDQIPQILAPVIRERGVQIDAEVKNQADHIFNATVHPLVESLCGRVYAEETVLVGFFDALLRSVVRDVCKHTFLKYQAQELNRLRTLCTHFEIWKMCLQRRQNKVRSQDLILSMPAYPSMAADSICLAGARVAAYSERRQDSPVRSSDAPTPSKRSRFSQWADKVDFDLAWRPLDPLPSIEDAQLGIILPTSLPISGLPPLSTHSLLFSWLLSKLGRYRTLVLPSPPTALDLSSLSALIAVDMPPPALEALRLPTLNVCTVSAGTLQDEEEEEEEDKPEPSAGRVHVLCLASPTCHATLAYSWTPQLQDGLYWLSEVFAEEGFSRRQEPDYKDTSLSLAVAAAALPFASTLMDAALMHVENCFLLPLLNLLENWSTQGLVDPSPQIILEAYNKCVDHLHTSSLSILSPSPSPSAFNAGDLLRVDSDLLAKLPSSFTLGATPSPPSWEATAQAWSLFVDSILPDSYSLRVAKLSAVLFARRRTNLMQKFQSRDLDAQPCAAFAPWTAVCIHLVRTKLEALCAACTENSSALASSSLAQPLDGATEARLLEVAANSLTGDFSSPELSTSQWPGLWLEDFFASSGEPMYTFKSVASFYDAIPLTPSARSLKVAQPTKTEQLLSQLDSLESRLKRVSEDAKSLSKGTQ